jgi:hypothetical protein
MRKLRYLVSAALLLAACASAKKGDGEETAKSVKEVVAGSARIRGGGMRMDVQIGRQLTTAPSGNGKVTASPNAAVAP